MYLLVITYRRSIIFAIIVSRSKDLKFYHLLGRLSYYGLLEAGNKHSRSRKEHSIFESCWKMLVQMEPQLTRRQK